MIYELEYDENDGKVVQKKRAYFDDLHTAKASCEITWSKLNPEIVDFRNTAGFAVKVNGEVVASCGEWRQCLPEVHKGAIHL